jgi:hypothetical protein
MALFLNSYSGYLEMHLSHWLSYRIDKTSRFHLIILIMSKEGGELKL